MIAEHQRAMVGTPEQAFIDRLADLIVAVSKTTGDGELRRLTVYIEEARNDYWSASTQDHEARSFMWQQRFDEPGKTAWAKLYEIWKHERPSKVRLDPVAPTIETFFDYWGEKEPKPTRGKQAKYAKQIDEAEQRLGVPIRGFVRELFTYDNGGYTDFYNSPLGPWSPLVMEPDTFWDNWEEPFPNNMLVSVQHWKTVEAFMIDHLAQFDYPDEPADDRWKASQRGLDRLIALSTKEHKHTGARTIFCLDYRDGDEPGAVVIRETEAFGGPLEELRSWPNFERFVSNLRRFPLREIDGVVRVRDRIVEILDDGVWRHPRG